MATGDGVVIYGAYAEIQASDSPADGAMSQGAVQNIATAIPGNDKNFLIDFKIIVTSGTPATDGYIAIYKRQDDQPAPTISYLQTFVGNARLNTVTGNYHYRGAPNEDSLDSFYALNNSGAPLTYSMQARGRTYRAEV